MIYPGEPGYPSASAYGSGGGITDVDIDYGGGVGNNITRKTYPWELSGYKGTQVACNWGQGEPYHLMMPMISANKHAYAAAVRWPWRKSFTITAILRASTVMRWTGIR